jgi:nucleoside phosphorylase
MDPKADVLIVTVTKGESLAVLSAFEKETRQKALTVPIGDRVYRDLGMLGGARIFQTRSEMGAIGIGSSLQSVQKGIAALSPSAVIMVGIAFGVSEAKQKIGDVLVSRQLMLYDLQRIATAEGGSARIVPRGDRPHASGRLINYLHNAELDWEGSQIHFGLVLTGEKLVDNVDFRAQLRDLESEAIGGEMEGAGLYVACQDAKVDWVLVKSICDWADGNKAQDKEARQRLAAENAVSFLLHALKQTPIVATPKNPEMQNAGSSGTQVTQQSQQFGNISVTGSGNSVTIQQHSDGSTTTPQTPFSAAQSTVSGSPKPTPFSLRKLMEAILRTSGDLDAFCIDHFPDVARRFSGGMTRTAREDLLLQIVDADEILAALRLAEPGKVQKHLGLLNHR